jgi:hypothetical protein
MALAHQSPPGILSEGSAHIAGPVRESFPYGHGWGEREAEPKRAQAGQAEERGGIIDWGGGREGGGVRLA